MSERIVGPLATIEVVGTADPAISWDEMWNLIQRFYEAKREDVEELIRHHGSVALFRAADDARLVGIAALDIYPTVFEGRKVAVIFTSHVMLDEAFRGHNLLQRLGWRMFLRTRARYPLLPIYWFFDSFGYKSYLVMPRNFRDFWPRRDHEMPPWERGLMNHLAVQMYRDAWQPELGIVRRTDHKRLRPEAVPLQADYDRDPDLAFYARANPGHAEGDGLVCLCPLSFANLVTLGLRARHRRHRAASAG
ncbi:MAG: hypothetical protein ACXWG1_18800 [Usitatibacter sp.]